MIRDRGVDWQGFARQEWFSAILGIANTLACSVPHSQVGMSIWTQYATNGLRQPAACCGARLNFEILLFQISDLKMVGDPGIEPGVRLREGVTVPCHTLRPVAHMSIAHCVRQWGVITSAIMGRQDEIGRWQH